MRSTCRAWTPRHGPCCAVVPCARGDGEIEATLTAVMPYASIQISQRLKLWGALGYGEGDVTLKPQTGGSLESRYRLEHGNDRYTRRCDRPTGIGAGPGDHLGCPVGSYLF